MYSFMQLLIELFDLKKKRLSCSLPLETRIEYKVFLLSIFENMHDF